MGKGMASNRQHSRYCPLYYSTFVSSNPPTIDDLTTAAVRGDLAEIKRILDEGVDVNAVNQYGRTALQVMKASRADVADLLLSCGANPNIMDFSSHFSSHTRMTPTHDIARQGYLDTIRTLLRYGADITLRDAAGNTPAHLAAKSGQYHVVRYFSYGMDLKRCYNHAGLTPLDYPTSAKRRHLRKWLFKARKNPSELSSLACEKVRSLMGTNRLNQMEFLPVPEKLKERLALQHTPAGYAYSRISPPVGTGGGTSANSNVREGANFYTYRV